MRDARGRFLPGPDPDRHFLTKLDCQKGFMVATQMKKMPSRLRAWLRKKITRYYQERLRRSRSPGAMPLTAELAYSSTVD